MFVYEGYRVKVRWQEQNVSLWPIWALNLKCLELEHLFSVADLVLAQQWVIYLHFRKKCTFTVIFLFLPLLMFIHKNTTVY